MFDTFLPKILALVPTFEAKLHDIFVISLRAAMPFKINWDKIAVKGGSRKLSIRVLPDGV